MQVEGLQDTLSSFSAPRQRDAKLSSNAGKHLQAGHEEAIGGRLPNLYSRTRWQETRPLL